MARYLKNLHVALRQVFACPSYIMLAGTLATTAFLLAVWLPNLGLITQIFSGSDAPLTVKLNIMFSLLGGINTNFSHLSAAYTIAIAMLFGITAAMITYLLKQRRLAAAGQNIAIGSGAMASGAFGIGCAACGSLIAGTILPSLGATGALAMLPLNGEEFGILSVVLLLVSLALISKSIVEPVTCALDRTKAARNP